MWYFTEIADWWEGKRKETDAILDCWVHDSGYSQRAMIVAATTKALTRFGAGFVDILRLGDGVKGGTLKGAGVDALRFVAIFPFGKAAQTLQSVRGVTRAKLIADVDGPHCFWVASAKALTQTGHRFKGKLFVSVEDLAKARGMSMNRLWEVPNLSTGISYLRRIGIRVGAIRKVSTEKDIMRMVPHDGSVVMISVRLKEKRGKVDGHVIYAFRTIFGQVRYMDRTVETASSSVYKNIAEVASHYEENVIAFIPYQAAVLRNMYAKSVGHDIPRLAIPVLGVIATEDDQ